MSVDHGAIGRADYPGRGEAVVAYVPTTMRKIHFAGVTGDMLSLGNFVSGAKGWPSAALSVKGIVRQGTSFVARQVFVFGRGNPGPIAVGVGTSLAADGSFSVPCGNFNGPADVFVIDPNLPPAHNTQVFAGITPY